MQRGDRHRTGNKAETREVEGQAYNEDLEVGASGKAAGTEGEEGKEPTLKDLAGILQAFKGQQEMREARLKEESTQQEHRLGGLYSTSFSYCS